MKLSTLLTAGKDLSIKPGDNFYDYCNGTWLKNTPIPATSAVGGIYEQATAMEARVKELRTKVPDIEKFYSLKEAASGQPVSPSSPQLHRKMGI